MWRFFLKFRFKQVPRWILLTANVIEKHLASKLDTRAP
jgi:hypothetical protein